MTLGGLMDQSMGRPTSILTGETCMQSRATSRASHRHALPHVIARGRAEDKSGLGSVIPKLLQLLGDEYKLQRGVKKNVDSLSKELKHIHAFLSKVSDVP
ncbi:hypothetical protein EJB05_26263, partial [Eragrostis curvula]